MDTEDQRDVELSTLSAIFPEIQRVHEQDPYTFVLDVPVNPSKAVTVFFPAVAEGQGLAPGSSQSAVVGAGEAPSNGVDSHELAHLPAVRLQFTLPPSYPDEEPPAVSVSTSPSWLPSTTAEKLEKDCAALWEDIGRDLVVFAYIDQIQQSAEDVFGLVSDRGVLEISPEHKIAVLDHDIEAKRVAFENGTFNCGVCLGRFIRPYIDPCALLPRILGLFLLTYIFRSEEGCKVSSHDRLWSCVLYRVLAGLLQ